MTHSYESHFVKANFNIEDFIQEWPNELQKNDFRDANMIFVPCNIVNGKEVISRKNYYCSVCKKWLKICDSIKQIKNHASIHVPEIFKKTTNKDNTILSDEEKKQRFIQNITAFILLETNSFCSIESPFLKKLSDDIPSREKIIQALTNVSNYVRNKIKTYIATSSANYLTFDQWTDPRNREYLGITIRTYISGIYYDFFLDLIYLYAEINDSDVLSKEIINSLNQYNLTMEDIISCTTDNCPLMIQTADKLLSWRIPCVIHLLNRIFQCFVVNIKDRINPIFELVKFLNRSTKYQSFIDREAKRGIIIKKVPSYTEVRWTSFCDCITSLNETLNSINHLFDSKYLNKTQTAYLHMLNKLCTNYKRIILFYESDSFGALGFFLSDMNLIITLFTELENSDFHKAVTATKELIDLYKKKYSYFWSVISPIALLLNPKIEKYRMLLTDQQIESSKNEIERRMKRYPMVDFENQNQNQMQKQNQNNEENEDLRILAYKNDEKSKKDEVKTAPIVNLLEKRNHNIDNLQLYWEAKVGTEENQLALVALEVLGALATSAMSERSFSKGRYVINEHRTKLTPEHARDHMLIKCNKEIATECINMINILDS